MKPKSHEDLTAQPFTKLFESLGENQENAGEKYEELRRGLIRFFEQQGEAFPEDLTDEALDRVGKAVGAGAEIKNIDDYCYKVARYLLMWFPKENESGREQGA